MFVADVGRSHKSRLKAGALSNEKLVERSEERERQELACKIKPRMGSVGKRS